MIIINYIDKLIAKVIEMNVDLYLDYFFNELKWRRENMDTC